MLVFKTIQKVCNIVAASATVNDENFSMSAFHLLVDLHVHVEAIVPTAGYLWEL